MSYCTSVFQFLTHIISIFKWHTVLSQIFLVQSLKEDKQFTEILFGQVGNRLKNKPEPIKAFSQTERYDNLHFYWAITKYRV